MVYISCSFIRKFHLYAHRAKNKQNPSEACVSHPHSWLYCVRINKRASKNQDSNTSSLNSVKLPKPSCFMAALRVFDASIKRTLHITLGLIPVDSLFLHLVCECDGEHTQIHTSSCSRPISLTSFHLCMSQPKEPIDILHQYFILIHIVCRDGCCQIPGLYRISIAMVYLLTRINTLMGV